MGAIGLDNARRNKKDEFYTMYEDIENELKHYDKSHFKDKVVMCNCDDYEVSNFTKYFEDHFDDLQLKGLISCGYVEGGHGKMKVQTREKTFTKEINEDGSFKCQESIELLKKADIVITNPPFSLFREYIDTLVSNGKQFIVMGNTNAISYKNVFSLIKEDKIWSGYNFNYTAAFKTPYNENGIAKIPIIAWFTNIPHDGFNRELMSAVTYREGKYDRYENYDAINVDKMKELPIDYEGVMGVPLTFIGRYVPERMNHTKTNRYKIIAFRKGNDDKDLRVTGRNLYFRVLIQKY